MAVIGKRVLVGEGGSEPSRVTRKSGSESKRAFSSRDVEALRELATANTTQTPEPLIHKEYVRSNIYNELREALRADISNLGIARAPPGSHELLSLEGDGYYGWQFYLRAPLLNPRNLNFIGRVFWNVYGPRFRRAPFQLAGIEAASVPVLTSVLLHGAAGGIECNAFTIRKERKKYGLQNLIEGQPNELPVVIIDDLASTEHNALWHAVNALRGARLTLYPTCFVVVFKGRRTSPRELPTSIGTTKIESIFTLENFDLNFESSFTRKPTPGVVP